MCVIWSQAHCRCLREKDGFCRQIAGRAMVGGRAGGPLPSSPASRVHLVIPKKLVMLIDCSGSEQSHNE